MHRITLLSWCALALMPAFLASPSAGAAAEPALLPAGASRDAAPALTARVIAVGLRGAGAVAGVGYFHAGGPVHDKPAFAAYTQPGRVLDAQRILVASTSNFGAPRALADAAEGSVLSIDPGGPTLVVPPDFARAGGQASVLDGRVQLFAAQSPAFLNSVRTPGASSAAFPTVSNPLGISINNGFGRLWFANAPGGAQGLGTESIADPSGEPLAGAPSPLVGGVFAGALTNRPQQIIPGALQAGAVASAFLGASPDGSKRAVFAVLTADGAVAQAHTEFALDGLAPPGTLQPLLLGREGQGAATRAGMVFNWVPNRVLYVTEPGRNAIAALTLTSDEKVFRLQGSRRYTPPELDQPVDLAPVVPEVANPGFASNTTLAGNSDLYVANRGSGSLVRLRQDGTVVAVRRIRLPDGQMLGAGQLNGIAVSPDAQKILLTLSGAVAAHPDAPGALIEVPAFGSSPLAQAVSADAERVAQGQQLFSTDFTPAQGLGPLFNERSCVACHSRPTAGGAAHDGLGLVRRVGRYERGTFDPLTGHGGPVARERTVAELGVACSLKAGPPPGANLISVRIATALYGLGQIDAIPDEAIRAGAAAQQASFKGRVNVGRDAQGRERVGRYGWKADVATLDLSVAGAFRNVMGITNPLAPSDLVDAGADCGAKSAQSGGSTDDDGTLLRAVAAYARALPPPAPRRAASQAAGEQLFADVGCAGCHTPSLPSASGPVALYSDLLLHDMGPALDDGVTQGRAQGADWRTSLLWGVGQRVRYLHDGRATTLREATLAHDGDAAGVTRRFRALTQAQQDALIDFLTRL